MKDIKEYSEIFKKTYEVEDGVYILNTKQAGKYIKHGVPLLNIFWSNDNLIFVFDKEKSKPFYTLWCKHELD